MTMTSPPGADRADGLLGGRYALGEVLGVGSSAVVRRAEDVRTGRFVAVKLFSVGGSPVEHRRRRREVEALTRLRHPGLVRLLDGDPTGACPFVVTELVEGPTLAQALVEGAWGAERVRRVGGGGGGGSRGGARGRVRASGRQAGEHPARWRGSALVGRFRRRLGGGRGDGDDGGCGGRDGGVHVARAGGRSGGGSGY
ncbi:hypothetical protein H6H00_17190 [Pseudonocardia petroleophila]|uniref:Protein kinase domain-containing protein n=1 Tax=Pseudonocardia petroleophila TaxID=37331 RepID=A0A7G7MB49_9PSEU|nr:hypothetical protein H6H00_17190 [Pseudonocardia petroleophila]